MAGPPQKPGAPVSVQLSITNNGPGQSSAPVIMVPGCSVFQPSGANIPNGQTQVFTGALGDCGILQVQISPMWLETSCGVLADNTSGVIVWSLIPDLTGPLSACTLTVNDDGTASLIYAWKEKQRD